MPILRTACPALARWGLLLIAGLVALTLAGTAPCQEEDPAVLRAREAFHEALELEQARDWARALRKFREVGQVKMTPQVRFHVAWCEENLGRLVAALGGYELALADAEEVGPGFKTEVEEKIAALRQRIPKLVIVRGSGAGAATVELDGNELGASSIGIEVPTDPGPHSIVARAKGFADFETTVVLEEQTVQEVTLDLEPLPKTRAPEPAAPTTAKSAPPAPSRVGPLVLMGSGGGLLLGGATMFVLRWQKIEEMEDQCPRIGDKLSCPEEARDEVTDLRQKAKDFGLIGGVLVGAGAGAALGGTVWLLYQEGLLGGGASPKREGKRAPEKGSSPSREEPTLQKGKKKARLRFLPTAPGAEAGVSLTGQFL